MRTFPVLILLSSCGIVQLELPDVSRSFSLTVNGCSDSGELFRTTVSVAEMQKRIAGFRGCIETVEDMSITLDAMEYGAGDVCDTPRGSASGLTVHLDYSAQGLAQTRSLPCDETIDLADEEGVLEAFNRCLGQAVAKKDVLIDALNDSSGVMTVRLTGECSADACFSASANLSVDLGGIVATNCP